MFLEPKCVYSDEQKKIKEQPVELWFMSMLCQGQLPSGRWATSAGTEQPLASPDSGSSLKI